MSSGYARKREQTRDRLVAAGMTVLAEGGTRGATVADLAAKARVSPGTFYNHFRSMDHVVAAVADRLTERLRIGAGTLTAIEYDPAVRLGLNTQQLVGMAFSEPTAAAAFLALDHHRPPGERGRIHELIATTIREGIDRGRFAPVHVDTAVDAVVGAVVQWMHSALAHRLDTGRAVDRVRVVLAVVGVAPADVDAAVERTLEIDGVLRASALPV
ncbi:MAG: TetR/AcrR family transcriptional regulator [Acidimicrobiales bacterium]